MFTDPISVTVGTTPHTLPRTGSGMGTGSFQTPDGSYRVDVSHSQGRRRRSTLRLSTQKISADPLVPSQNSRSSMSTYIVVDSPLNGFSQAEISDVVKALAAYLTASSNAAITKLVGGEA